MIPTTPNITALYGISLQSKRRSIFTAQAQVSTISFQFLNDIGNPIDLEDYLIAPDILADLSVEVKIRECISTKHTDTITVSCTIDDSATGMVSFDLPISVTKNPGVYTAEFAAFSSNSLVLSNKCFIWVDRGLFGQPRYPNAGPPSLDEVRLTLRDNAPEENRLLDDYEFDLAEVCHAAETAVRIFNESQPPINLRYTTITYCVRQIWIKYITGHLLQVAARRFMKNQLNYQAGGISIDDQNKFQIYEQIATMLIQEYKDWVKNKKVQINCEMAITSSGSGYGAYGAYTLMNTGI